LGIDLSLQSATKYISGHSDTIAGVLSGSAATIARIFKSEYNNIGSGIQPFNAWLLLRGLRTLPLRLERITATTQKVILFLKEQTRVEEVIFPFDTSFPQNKLAKKQMNGACGLLTFILKDVTLLDLETFCESLQHIVMAVSWGGHESLIIPRCAGMPIKEFDAQNKEHRMLRLYVGLEEADYLTTDLQGGFDSIAK
jgi:cystathionine beta-lyase/cystathionine gamma-synthase